MNKEINELKHRIDSLFKLRNQLYGTSLKRKVDYDNDSNCKKLKLEHVLINLEEDSETTDDDTEDEKVVIVKSNVHLEEEKKEKEKEKEKQSTKVATMIIKEIIENVNIIIQMKLLKLNIEKDMNILEEKTYSEGERISTSIIRDIINVVEEKRVEKALKKLLNNIKSKY